MTFPFLFDDADDIAHLKKRRVEYVTNLETRSRLANMAAPPALVQQCILAQEKAALEIQSAQLGLARHELQQRAGEQEIREAEAEMIARKQLTEHRGKSAEEILRLIEDRIRAAVREKQRMEQLAQEGERAAENSIQDTQQARERTLLHILRQYAGERAVNNMEAMKGWAWRHLAQDVNAAMSPHVRDELGRFQYYYVREQRALGERGQEKDLPSESGAAHSSQPPPAPPKRMGR